MLQKELQKKEDMYKDMIDEYEKLRFRHCSVVQELEGSREVQKKVSQQKVEIGYIIRSFFWNFPRFQIQDENNKLYLEKENNKNNQKRLIETLKDELDHRKQE